MKKGGILKICASVFFVLAILILVYSQSCLKDDKADAQSFTAAEAAEMNSKMLSQAWELFRVGNMPGAGDIFTAIFESYTSSEPQRIQALFGLGSVCEFSSPAKPKDAENYFMMIAHSFPNSSVAPWAVLRAAQLQDIYNTEGREKARTLFQDILSNYKGSSACDETILSLAGTYFVDTDPEVVGIGLKTLEDYIAAKPDNLLITSMLFRLSYWYQEVQRDYVKGFEYGLTLGEIKMCNPNRQAMQYWGLGQMLSIKFGDYQEALKWYNKVVAECPRDYLTYAAAQKAVEMQQKIHLSGVKDE